MWMRMWELHLEGDGALVILSGGKDGAQLDVVL
jgi:hypothetical protein